MKNQKREVKENDVEVELHAAAFTECILTAELMLSRGLACDIGGDDDVDGGFVRVLHMERADLPAALDQRNNSPLVVRTNLPPLVGWVYRLVFRSRGTSTVCPR